MSTIRGKGWEFTLDEKQLEDALEFALDDTVLRIRSMVRDIAPRDPRRPPKNPNAKVTGNLKRSINSEKVGKFSHIVGTNQGEAEYGWYQEFGTRFMPPRSFLRLAIIENEEVILQHFAKTAKDRLRSFLK